MIPMKDNSGPVGFFESEITGGTKPTLMSHVTNSEIVVTQSSLSYALNIVKNKWGEMGNDIALEKFSYIVGRMIAQKFFSGLHNMFQEGMAQDIQEAIIKIINNYQPKEKKGKKFYDHF